MYKNLIKIMVLLILMTNCSENEKTVSIKLDSDWKFKTGDDLSWAQSSFDDSGWDTIKPGVTWETQGYSDYNGYAWYRKTFYLPSSLREDAFLKDSLRIILGKIDDTDQTFLNGELIGVNGKDVPVGTENLEGFTHDYDAYGYERVYDLSADDERIKWDEPNTLAVRVHDHGGGGGMYTFQQKVKMLDFDEFLVLDPYSSFYELNDSGYFSKGLIIKNKSEDLTIEGDLAIEVISSQDGSLIKEEEYSGEIFRPGDIKEFNFDFKENKKDRYIVEYEFEEKNSGKEMGITQEVPYILTPNPSKTPAINGPDVFGARPGSPFLYAIPVSGQKPMTYQAENLPVGLTLDGKKGLITGVVEEEGEYSVLLTVKNDVGTDTSQLFIKIGEKIALTPPLGWNSWNCWGLSVDADKVKQAADFMVSSGLKDHGWTYINIDDGWEAGERTKNGILMPNEKFPDMKELADYVHSKGLKLGIYSSPGPKTCGQYLGSYQYEQKDANTWAEWGIDYLKYDWCSYREIAEDNSLEELQKPYLLMRDCLDKVNRDIVYSLCQYGMGEVWKWGADVGGNLWRTTGDIVDSWESMSSIGFSQDKCSPYAKPGHWNDPDMLVVGWVGWGPDLHPTRLSPSEQYTHISLWSLLAAPLLLGNDLSKMDDFTINLLTNDEVLAVNQDPLGVQASKVYRADGLEYWTKKLADDNRAVGIFNLDDDDRVVNVNFSDLKVDSPGIIRDLWRQENITKDKVTEFTVEIPAHGVSMVKVIFQ